MNYQDLEILVEQWAESRGILKKGTPIAQGVKTLEEVNEMLSAILSNDKAELEDAIGDVVVTLIIQCRMNDILLEDCLFKAYEVISKRKGAMVDGVFVKSDV